MQTGKRHAKPRPETNEHSRLVFLSEWTVGPEVPLSGLNGAVSAPYNGSFVVAGGADNDGEENLTVFGLVDGQWTELGELSERRLFSAGVVAGNDHVQC